MQAAFTFLAAFRTALRGLLPCAFVLLGWFAMDAAQAATYRFDGRTINGCTLSGAVYTCATTGLPNWDDKAVIASGYTVHAQSDVSFGYNQGLEMSGTARLTSTGSIDLSGLNPANLVVNGGSFSAGGRFAVTGANPFRADVTAASLTLGTGSRLQLSGTMVARGSVSIGSNTTFSGALGGATITTSSPVTLNADITATTSFTLASGSTVTGNLTAPEVQLNAAGSVVTGDVTASKSLTMGSSVRIKGAVDAGKLTMQASGATIEGPATVDSATLYWAARVTDRITCRNGTARNKCDCVDNQSGYPVNSAEGPKCDAGRPAPSALDHFLITHDGAAQTCARETVTVTACADANCSRQFTGSTNVTLQPGNVAATITGSGPVEISSAVKGSNILSLATGGSAPTVRCYDSSKRTASCAINFTGDVGFDVAVKDHKAGNLEQAILTALKPNENRSACVPAFSGARTVAFSCSYTQPDSGDQPLTLAGDGDLQCRSTASTQRSLIFENAQASIGLRYGDAGRVTLNAVSGEIKGSGAFVVAPDHFVIATQKPLRAGKDFTVKLSARNRNNGVTKNFHSASFAADLLKVGVSRRCGVDEPLDSGTATFERGEGTASANFPEVGYIGLQAQLTDFMQVKGLNTTGETSCPRGVGPFLPAYFQVDFGDLLRRQDPAGKTPTFYYAREPIPLAITAMNGKGQVTKNYPGQYGLDHVLTLNAVAIDGAPLAESIGKLDATPLPLKVADYFKDGVAALKAPPAAAAFRFKEALTRPTRIRLRAQTIGTAAGETSENYRTSSDGAAPSGSPEPELARPEIRAGRLRIGNHFGNAGSTLRLPVTAEYWSGESWLLNSQDNFTIVPASAIAQSPYAHAGSTKGAPPRQAITNVTLAGGNSSLPLQSERPGWIDVAFNLGSAGADQSCLTVHPSSTGANLPWLQAPASCRDPSGRATFGIFAPDSRRRVIHVREVFN